MLQAIPALETELYSSKTLSAISKWMLSSGFYLTLKKSERILLTGKKKKIGQINLHLNGRQIKIVNRARYLKVHLERLLNGKSHAKMATTKKSQITNSIAEHIQTAKCQSLMSFAWSITLFGIFIWMNKALNIESNKKLLQKAYRLATFIWPAYRTASIDLPLVLIETPPYDEKVKKKNRLWHRENRMPKIKEAEKML